MQEIKYIPIGDLSLHPDNPRFIKDDQFEVLCKSIKANPDYFEARPILCNPAMVIFAGNMRYRAAKEIGLEKVPVAVMDISEEKQRELMIRDNVNNGNWDTEALANNWPIDKLEDWGFEFPPEMDMRPNTKYHIIIKCNSEIDQESIFKDFSNKGYDVKKKTVKIK